MADLWTHIGFARLADLLRDRAGLVFAPNRQPAAEGAMRRAMHVSGSTDPVRYAEFVARDEEALGALLAEVTVGESYFFREPGQLAFIRDEVFPSFRGLRSPSEPLRCWSAGCASGEEAYTLAMLLAESGWRGAGRVLGTDISRVRLDAAQRARYTKWAMRGVAEETIERYFIRRGPHFLVRPDVRAVAEFRLLNLASREWDRAGPGIARMDVVLCRNVMIYFDRRTVAEVAQRLLASLAPDGWLFLGASDPMIAELADCETVVTGAGVAYRRPTPGAARRPRPMIPHPAAGARAEHARPSVESSPAVEDESFSDAAEPAAASAIPLVPVAPLPPPVVFPDEGAPSAAAASAGDDAYAGRDYGAAVEAARERLARDPADRRAWILLVRALANVGRIEEAERACVEALQRVPETAEMDYLHSVLLVQRGQFAAAAAAARRALYLDRSLAVAQLALADALAREGQLVQARRAFRAAERLLAQLPVDTPVPLADGELPRRLLEAARAQRERLGEVIA